MNDTKNDWDSVKDSARKRDTTGLWSNACGFISKGLNAGREMRLENGKAYKLFHMGAGGGKEGKGKNAGELGFSTPRMAFTGRGDNNAGRKARKEWTSEKKDIISSRQ